MASPTYQITDPSTGEVVETFEHTTDAEIEAALEKSHAAYVEWAARPLAERAAIVKKAGEIFGERKDELASIIQREMGKAHDQGVEEAEFAQAIFDYFATEGPELAADQPIKTFEGGTAVVQKLPIGALLGVMPWNFPYYQIARFAAPNLVLGNTVLLKHAESVPRAALVVEEILQDAGLPDGVYQNVFATHDQIATIIADPRVQGVSLTGSERAGAIIGELAGKNLKKCVLELGGNDPMVVLDTDDLDAVVSDAWDFRVYNGGQVCNANKRMIIHEDVYDDFVAKITEKALAVTDFAPLSSRRAAEDLDAQVQDAVSKGATLHAGGVLGEGPAAFYTPAVLTGITQEMRAYSEELFGPVASIYKVSSDEEALELANDTQYGLGGSVIAKDEARARAIAEQLQVGMANVNSIAGEGAEIPFGGVKRSGFGRELGPLGMDEFVNKRMFYVAD